jgi:hypothetical protein
MFFSKPPPWKLNGPSLNVIEDEEHFFFHCQKNELLRKEFLTQIENLFTNNHIQNITARADAEWQ